MIDYKLTLFKRMLERNKVCAEQSDTDYFLSLMYTGELLTKVTTAGLLSGIGYDVDRTKYSLEYKLVRADGIGEWVQVLDEILAGPTSHLLGIEMHGIKRELTVKSGEGTWQFETVQLIYQALKKLGVKDEPLAIKLQAKNWFSLFVRMRNLTRGHGAFAGGLLSIVCPLLNSSINLMIENLSLFDLEWAFVQRNISGRYRISNISESTNSFNYLKKAEGAAINLENGVYTYLSQPTRVDLLESDVDLTDFFLPNGAFTTKKYEMISYVSGDLKEVGNSAYLTPPENLPRSETEGLRSLEVRGSCFTNIPSFESIYIERKELERELSNVLGDDRHPVVTLIGRGGIGKTSLALKVLHNLCNYDRFQLIIWFSARDIDLLETGAKPVQPQVIDVDGICKAFALLVQPTSMSDKEFSSKKYLESELQRSTIGPLLIVIDNFETVSNPIELFNWLDTHVRLPNKVLITSRIREFKADYPIVVSGMSSDEFSQLTATVSNALRISELLNKEYVENLFQETGGHPYIAKIMLGEVARERKPATIRKVAASKEDLLNALFERTYNNLAPSSKLIFLTLSGWRSILPRIAVEAVVKSKSSDFFDAEEAVEELIRFSFIDVIKSKSDGSEFLFLPLSTYVFGQKKLSISPLKPTVQEYLKYLSLFGVGHLHNISQGLFSRLTHFFNQVALNISIDKKQSIEDFLPILEYICHKYYSFWITLAVLYESRNRIEDALASYGKYLETEPDDDKKIQIWNKVALINKKRGRYFEEVHALLEISSILSTPFDTVSYSVWRIMTLIREGKLMGHESETTTLVKRMINILSNRIDEGTDDDMCKLAWLHLMNSEFEKAKIIVKEVLSRDPDNQHALNLSKKLR